MTGPTDYFQTICKISRAFGTTANLDHLLDMVVQEAVKTMKGKAAALFLLDEEQDLFLPVAQTGLSDNYLHMEPNQAKKGVKEIIDGGYLAIQDAVNDPRVENRPLKKAEGIASILVVPAMVKGKSIGILSLYTGEQRDFSQDEIDFLMALAEQGGMAIQNAQLFDQIRKNAELFLQIASGINSSLDIKKILHILTADMAEALNLKAANIRLLNQDTQNLDLVATYGLSEDFLNKGPISADKSISDAMKGKTVIIQDAPNDERVQYREAMKKEGIVTIVSSPIRSGDEVIGVMRLFSGYKRDYNEAALMFINAIANQGGLAIRNASLYLQLKNDKECLEKDVWSHRMWF